MSNEDTEKSMKLLKEIDRWIYLVGIITTIGGTVLYCLIKIFWQTEKNDIISVTASEYLLNLMPNIISTSLIAVLSYLFLRRIKEIRTKVESGKLVAHTSEQVQTAVASQLQTIQQTMDKCFVHAELGNAVYSLGIAHVTSNWNDLTKSQHPLGANFRHRLNGMKSPATWYIITTTTLALRVFDDEIADAVKRGIHVKWVYYSVSAINKNPALKMQMSYLSRSFSDRPESEGLEMLGERSKALIDFGQSVRNDIRKQGIECQKDVGNLELYTSEMVHPYLAFLAVPEEYKELPEHASPKPAPPETFGFVQLFPIFPPSFHERPALYFDAPGGKILDEYYWSTLRLFDWGIQSGKIQLQWSLKKEGAIPHFRTKML